MNNDDGCAVRPRHFDDRGYGFSWIAHPEETAQRTSHALVDDGDIWVIDPVDMPHLDDRLADLGEVVGVVVLLTRHKRDAATVATRHDVPVTLPRQLLRIRDAIDAPVETFDSELASTGYRSVPIVTNRLWSEVALYHESEGTLLVPEAVGTTDAFLTPGERLGVHPVLRPVPPRAALEGLDPDRILVGHGEGVFDNADHALRDALRGSRSRMFQLYASILRESVGI